ncbi:hypothetical protein [Xanthobacter agilis]|uniref:hypothetical protein n=1 Tax=Xanthobacter agilis TaxID=47492 RepID=UPI003728D410
MTRARDAAGVGVPAPVTRDTVNLDAVVLEQIFLSAGARAGDAAERLRRRRLLRRLLRRPATRIASRRVKRKRLLDRLGREVLGGQLRAVRQERRGAVSRALSLLRPTPPRRPARPGRALRWTPVGRTPVGRTPVGRTHVGGPLVGWAGRISRR